MEAQAVGEIQGLLKELLMYIEVRGEGWVDERERRGSAVEEVVPTTGIARESRAGGHWTLALS